MLSKHDVKIAFLEKCASLGMNAAQIEAAALEVLAMVKQAEEGVSTMINPLNWLKSVPDLIGSAANAGTKAIDLGRTAVNTGLQYGVALPYGAAAGAGLGAGFAAGKALSPQQTADEVKNQEVADAYRQYAEHIQRQAQLAKEQEQRKIKSPSFR